MPLAKKRRLDDGDEDGKVIVSLADKPDYPDSEPRLAFKQAQARFSRVQQQKDEEDRIAGENALTREKELELVVSDLKRTLEKCQADAIANTNKDRETEARIFEAESRRKSLEETLSTFKEETNKRLKLSTERNKSLEAKKQQAASQYGAASLENQ